jgi:biotin carboxyl carrier protein
MKKDRIYTAQVNGIFDFEIDANQPLPCDIYTLPATEDKGFHVLKEGGAFRAGLIAADYDEKCFTIRVDGVEHQVQLRDEYDRLIQKMGLHATGGSKMNEVKAPMPGLVLELLVEPGQAIEKGDPLLILEAMKMENVIKATGNGTVKNIPSTQGQAVEKGQLLIELE